MNRVLLVGAGGSLAEALHYRPVRGRSEYPPLDLDFFPRALELASNKRNIRTAIRRLRTAVDATGEFADPWDRSVPFPSLEQFFADVYFDVATGRKQTTFECFVSLLQLYRYVLAETTNWIVDRINGSFGILGRLLRFELERSAPDPLTIITFNHDLVIEAEVAKLPYMTDRWCIEGLYENAELESIEGPSPRFPRHSGRQDPCAHSSPVRLLKLHGSLNWVVRSRSADPMRSTVFPSNRTRKIYLHNCRHVFIDARIVKAWDRLVHP